MVDTLHEKCAVAGVVLNDDKELPAAVVYESLYALQHRGVEASGIASSDLGDTIHAHRGSGLVVDVYDEGAIEGLSGSVAVGHNRYSTSGAKFGAHLSPFVDTSVGLALSVNGNLPDTTRLSEFLSRRGFRDMYANDVELAGYAIAEHIRNGKELPDAVEAAYPLMTGAYSCVAMRDDVLVAFRDPNGIRPLALGEANFGRMVASETCGLDIVDANYTREVNPGELVVITQDGIESRQIVEGKSKLDMFELVYFARHDSRLYGMSVNEIRRSFGEQLAREHPPALEDGSNIVVVPVPDTSIPAAEGYADALGLRHSQAIIKNRYIGRTFMQPDYGNRGDRRTALRRKHNIIPDSVNGKDVYLIDDSIVRLSTMPRIVALAYESGARTVNVLIASPPIRFPDYYGIDTPEQTELAAANLTIAQIKDRLGNGKPCTYLGYLSLNGMVAATGMTEDKFNLSCFTGDYPIDIGYRRREIYPPVSMEGVE
jgi:amidophosphoribosyltransferase